MTSIHSQFASRNIPCERHARRFLADQGGLATSFPTLSARDVLCMVRNSCVVEKAILKFEKEIVRRVKSTFKPQSSIPKIVLIESEAEGVPIEVLEKYYGPGARKHPPSLTRTERLRFTRSYYQFWGMMELDSSKWPSRLDSITSLKQLYLLHEIYELRQRIGIERRPDPRLSGAELGDVSNTRKKRSSRRWVIRNRIWKQIKHIFQHFHDREPDPVWNGDKSEVLSGFVVMWDHWQPPREYISWGRRPIDPSTRASFEEQYLWEDNSDEEV